MASAISFLALSKACPIVIPGVANLGVKYCPK